MDSYLISDKATILDALKQIDNFSIGETKTLFVIDMNNKIIGSLSDGDCRRALIKNFSLDESVKKAMHTSFTYLVQNEYDIEKICKIKNLGIKYVPELDQNGHLIKVRDFSNFKSYIPVDAVMMAGGKGERLRPLTLTTPKPLLKVADKPIIDYNIDNLLEYGIENINVTVNYLKEQIENHFINPIKGIKINCVREPEFLGTMSSVRYIKKWHNDTILLMNSDLFTNIDLESFYFHYKKHNADMSVAVVPYNIDIPYGIFDIEGERSITGIKEKPSYYYYANAGIYLFKKELLSLIPNGKFYNATDFILDLIQKNKKIIRFPITGYWVDIGKHDDFKKVQEFAKNLRTR